MKTVGHLLHSQMLQHIHLHAMARELVLSTWTMLLALELKMFFSAVLMTVILQTVSTLRMLASYASVST